MALSTPVTTIFLNLFKSATPLICVARSTHERERLVRSLGTAVRFALSPVASNTLSDSALRGTDDPMVIIHSGASKGVDGVRSCCPT